MDSPWTTPPDATSEFMVISGSVWLLSSSASSPYFTWQYYDISADTWYVKGAGQSFFAAALGTDANVERLGEYAGVFDSGTATAGNLASPPTLTTNKNWTANRYAGYRIRITGGTGIGQQRVILSNTAGPNSVVTTCRNWDVAPDATSTWEIIADSDKFYFVGNNIAAIFGYSCDADAWSPSRIYDWGHLRNMAATRGTFNEGFALNTLSRSGSTTVTAATVQNQNFKVGDPITVSGCSTANYNGNWTVASVTSATGFTYVSGTNDTSSGTAANVTSNTTNAVLVDCTKNWTTNEHAGRLCSVILGSTPANATVQTRRITANTATTLTIQGVFGTGPTNGNYKYIIHDSKAFGWSLGAGGATSGTAAGWGTATGTQSTTQLADTTKNWPANYWIGKRVRFMSGQGGYQEAAITGSTATTLTFSALGTAPLTGETDYCIIEPAVHGAGTNMEWAAANSDPTTAGVYIYIWRCGTSPILDRYNVNTDRLDPVAYFPVVQGGLTTGSMFTYDGKDRIYFTKDATGYVYYMDVNSLKVDEAGMVPFNMGAAPIGSRIAFVRTVDGLGYLYVMRHSGTEFWRELVTGIIE